MITSKEGQMRMLAFVPMLAIGSSIALSQTPAPARSVPALPAIVVLATGGTIAGAASSDVQAGYTSGQVGVEQLLAAVPQAKKIANLRGEQIANTGPAENERPGWD